jgi:general secretion pathway protein F
MAIYKYRAKKDEGIAEGSIEAANEKEAIEKISRMGCLPTWIQQESGPLRLEAPFLAKPSPLRKVNIKSREVIIFSRQLASLLKSGVPILNALNIIKEQSENSHLRNILADIHNAVKEGSNFSNALAQYPHVFSPLYIAMVRIGEEGGAFPEMLLRIADHRAKQEEMLSRLRMASAYPLLMALVGSATVVFMLTFVMPRLMRIFNNMGEKLPLPTQILISVSQGLLHNWAWIIVIVCIMIFAIKRSLKTKAGQLSWSVFQLHLPVLGKLILKAELARFSRTLELLIKNGIPILKAIDIAVPVLENEVIKNQLRKSCKELEQGGSFGRSLKNSRWFPLLMSNLIIVGEESGRLDGALAAAASSYEQDTDDALKMMSTLLEPLMILGMGLIVGFIIVAMLLPIFEISPVR